MSNQKSALDVFKSKQELKENDNTNLQHHDTATSQHQYKERKIYKTIPWYPPSERLKKELKRLALDEDTSMSNLMTEGVALLFAKRGKSIEDYL